MEKENNLRIFRSTTAFENIRKIIIEIVASNYVLEKTESRDISGKVEMWEELFQYLPPTYTGPPAHF